LWSTFDFQAAESRRVPDTLFFRLSRFVLRDRSKGRWRKLIFEVFSLRTFKVYHVIKDLK